MFNACFSFPFKSFRVRLPRVARQFAVYRMPKTRLTNEVDELPVSFDIGSGSSARNPRGRSQPNMRELPTELPGATTLFRRLFLDFET